MPRKPLDDVRLDRWNEAHRVLKKMQKDNPQTPGRPKTDNLENQQIQEAKTKAKELKDSRFALGKAPEHLTQNQRLRLEIIAKTDTQLFRAYGLKEELRLILKEDDPVVAESALKRWMWRASHSRIQAFKELFRKIKRHKDHILNAIRFKMSNARIEAVNNKIKLIVRKAYGFRNINNLLDFVYLICSDLKISLPGRNQKSILTA